MGETPPQGARIRSSLPPSSGAALASGSFPPTGRGGGDKAGLRGRPGTSAAPMPVPLPGWMLPARRGANAKGAAVAGRPRAANPGVAVVCAATGSNTGPMDRVADGRNPPHPRRPCSLLPAPCSLLPAPCSLFPAPCSLLPVPCSLAPSPQKPQTKKRGAQRAPHRAREMFLVIVIRCGVSPTTCGPGRYSPPGVGRSVAGRGIGCRTTAAAPPSQGPHHHGW